MQPSIWPVIVSAIAASAIGYFWYHPRTFGKFWMRYNGLTPEMAERGAKRVHIHAIAGFVAFLIVAYVLRGFLFGFNVFSPIDAMRIAFYIWIGFAAPMLLGSVLWEHRSVYLYLINIGYWLAVLVVMAVILVV